MIRAFTTCDGQGINPALLGPEHRASRIQNRWGWRNNSCESECQERSYQCGFNGRVKWFPYYQYAELRGAAVHVHLLTGTDPQGLKVAGRGESTHTAPRQYRTPSRLKLFRSLCQQNWHELLKGEIGRQKLQLLYSSHPFPLPPAPGRPSNALVAMPGSAQGTQPLSCKQVVPSARPGCAPFTCTTLTRSFRWFWNDERGGCLEAYAGWMTFQSLWDLCGFQS